MRHIRDTAGALSEEMTLEEAGVPDGVREVTARRLRRLSEPTRAVLLVASVIGREFDYDVLTAVVPQDGDELVEALEEGVEARVLREAGHVGRYAFAHALVRATLYDSISQLRRARLHGRVGEALVRLRGGDLDPHLAMLAHHFAAGRAGRAARSRDRLRARRRAPRRPDARLGGGRAALPRGAAGARAGRAPSTTRAGGAAARARHVRGPRRPGGGGARDVPVGDPDGAPARRRDAADARRRSASRAVVGAVALRPGPRRAARRGAGGAPRGRLAAARAAARAHVAGALLRGRARAAASLSAEAVEIARRTGDPRTLATCLDARHYALWLPENVEQRLEVAAELRSVAEQTGDPSSSFRARAGRSST